MKVSVIVPAYNEERLLGATLNALVKACREIEIRGWQTEIIVCDNNSTDRTAEIARQHGAKVVFEPRNQIARARNTGARAATGDWLIFVDADSEPGPGLFRGTADQISTGKVVAGGAAVRMATQDRRALASLRLWNAVSRTLHWMAGSYIFCDAEAFRAVGGFNEVLFVAEEIDLSRKLKRYARQHARKIVILKDRWMSTSARKLHLYTVGDHLRFLLGIFLSFGKTLKTKEACTIWYDGRR